MSQPHTPPRAPPERRGERSDYVAARNGQLPAEALPTHLRWRLVAELNKAGWTDDEIADRTRMTAYTAGRIREGMGLAPNRPRRGGTG
jgi:hypothetical protein